MLRSADWSESGIRLVAHRAACVISVHTRGTSAQAVRDAGADPERCIGYVTVERAPNTAGSARVSSSQPFAVHRRRRRLCIDKLQPPPVQGAGPTETGSTQKSVVERGGCGSKAAIDF